MTPQRHRTWKHLPFLLATGFLIVGIASRLGGVPPAIEGERPELHASKHSGRWPGFAIIGSSGKCLAVAPSTGADANVQIATCNKGPEQLWRFNRRGEIRGSGNRCLTVVMQPGQNHGNVEVQACQGWAAQQWRIGPRGKIHGLHGRCLDVVDGRTEDGTNVQLFTCHNHIAQKWRTTKLTIVALGNKCVDRAGNGRTPGTNVWLYTCNATPAQTWKITMNGEIRGPGGTCLEVPQGQTHDGANAQLGACNRSSGQFWEVTSSGEIRGPGKKCLDVSGARTDDQTNIQLYTCNGTRAQRFKLVGPGYLATTQLAQNPQVPEAPSPEQPQEPLEDPNTPLPPQTIQAPNERPCLHWQVVEQKVCEPTLRCEYQGGTCQTTKNCRREPFRKSFTRRSCWKRPHLVYQTQRVCSPRMVTSKTVVCRDERFFTTSTRPDCGYQMVVDYVPKQVCDKTNCLQQQQCTNTPQRKCERRPVRKLVSECRDVPVRITKPQRVCNTVRQKKLVPKRVCPPSRGPQCQMQNVCTTVNERRCAPVRRTYVEMKCRTVTTYQMRTQQQCQNVPVRQTRYRQVCQQGPQRCTTQTNCPNSGNNSYCTNRHGDPRCRGCRSSRRCTPGQRICRNVPQTVTTFQRRCTTRTVRVPLPKQLCQKIPRVTTTQQCSVVPQRRCQTKRVCRPSGPSVCRTEMVAEYRDVQQCRMVTRPGVIQQRQCRNVQKTVVEEVCRMVGGRNCRTVTNCPTGPRRCRKKLVPVQAKRWVCKKMKIVRQPHVRRICRQQTVRRQLTQCRMERRVTRELRRHCEERRFFALVHRWRCDQGIDCTPGREVCNEVPVCRTRYDQVCAAW